jgi:hypothetical protein
MSPRYILLPHISIESDRAGHLPHRRSEGDVHDIGKYIVKPCWAAVTTSGPGHGQARGAFVRGPSFQTPPRGHELHQTPTMDSMKTTWTPGRDGVRTRSLSCRGRADIPGVRRRDRGGPLRHERPGCGCQGEARWARSGRSDPPKERTFLFVRSGPPEAGTEIESINKRGPFAPRNRCRRRDHHDRNDNITRSFATADEEQGPGGGTTHGNGRPQIYFEGERIAKMLARTGVAPPRCDG